MTADSVLWDGAETLIYLDLLGDDTIAVAFRSPQHFDAIKTTIQSIPGAKFSRKRTVPLDGVDTPIWMVAREQCERLVDALKTTSEQRRFMSPRMAAARQQWLQEQQHILSIQGLQGVDNYRVPGMNSGHSLYPFQTVGAEFLRQGRRRLLADTVGLGKTVQALAAHRLLQADGVIEFTLIICTASAIREWEKELRKFFAEPSIVRIQAYGSDKETAYQQRTRIYRRSQKQFRILSYDLTWRDWDELRKMCVRQPFGLILDEVQKVKDRTTKRAKAVKRISHLTNIVSALSATPLENRLEELYNIFAIVCPGVFGDTYRDFARFRDSYLELDFFGSVVGYHNVYQVAETIKPHMLRRRKEEVMDDLPEMIRKDIWVKLLPGQRQFYNQVAERTLALIDLLEAPENIPQRIQDDEGLREFIGEKLGWDVTKGAELTGQLERLVRAETLAQFTYLREVAQSAQLVAPGRFESAKTEELLDCLEQLDGAKVVIFCFFKRMTDILCQRLQDEGYSLVYIHGGVPDGKRAKLRGQFNADPDIQIYLTTDASREAINLQAAGYLINFDILFNPAAMVQRMGRIDRIDTKHRTLTYLNFIAEGTIEEHILDIIFQKQSLFDEVIEGGWTSERMTLRQIRSLITGEQHEQHG